LIVSDANLPFATHFLFVYNPVTFTYLQAEDLVETYLGDPNGIVQFRNIESSTHSCYALFANGHSSGNNTTTNEYLIPDGGIILSTGNPSDFAANDSGETTTDFGVDAGEPALESQLPNGANVIDACYIEFQFQCPPESEITIPTVKFDFVFGSEEYYNEDRDGVTLDYNDAFGIFLNGENIDLVPDGKGPVSVTNINDKVNSEYYIENEMGGRINMTSQYMDIEADGFTKELKVSTEALPGWNSIKFVIGDVGDGSLDSFVLLAGSLSCVEGDGIHGQSSAMDLYDKVRDEYTSTRAVEIPMPVAVGLAVLLGLIGLALPIIGLAFYKKRFPHPKSDES